MAVHGRYTRILLDEFDFSGVNNTAEIAVASESIDATTFQATGKEFVTVGAEGAITHNGYYTGSLATDLETALQARMATSTSVAAVLLGTNATSYPAYVLPGTGTKDLTINGSTGAVVTLNGGYHSGSGIKRGIVVFRGTISATGNQTSVDLASAGSSGGFAYVFVQTITGTATNASVKIQSSADNTTFADEVTLTFSAVGAQSGVMTGTVNRYVRLNTAGLGGATSFVLVAVACVSGVTM